MPHITKFIYDEVSGTEVETHTYVAPVVLTCACCDAILHGPADTFTMVERACLWGYSADDTFCKDCVDRRPAECTRCHKDFDVSDAVFTVRELEDLFTKGQILGYADGDALCQDCVDHAKDLCDEAVERSIERANEKCF